MTVVFIAGYVVGSMITWLALRVVLPSDDGRVTPETLLQLRKDDDGKVG